jgi:penicillin-binding protein 1A
MALSLNQKAPNFTLPSTTGEMFTLYEDAKAKSSILFFYPKDFTKGSTQESGGTALGLYRYGVLQYNEIAAKTGTTSNQSDGWFVGITKDLVNGVWVGGEDRSIHFRDLENGQGSRMAMPIWALYMKKVYEDKSLGITKGYFPKTDNEEILEKIDCKRYKETGQNGSDIDSSEYIIPKDHPIEDLN